MNNVKRSRKSNSALLAQLKIDQKFYDERLKSFREDESRKELSGLNEELSKETQKIQGIIKAQKRKDKGPKAEDLVEHTRLKGEISKIQLVINDIDNYKQRQAKGLLMLNDVSLLLNIVDSLTSKEKRELNNL